MSVLISPQSSLSLSLVLDVEGVGLPVGDVSVHQPPPHPPVHHQRQRH